MPTPLENIETVIILIMENRSFDHLLGYLSLPPDNRTDIEGFRSQVTYSNTYNNREYPVFQLGAQILEDPPHERETIALQMGHPPQEQAPFPMDGFVKCYAGKSPTPADASFVMGYHTASDVPMYDFFAKQFAVCDHWFSSLPTGTQPNRLMAMAGETPIENNAPFLLPNQDLVYDWLKKRGISWCCYHAGKLPFFSLMKRWQKTILEDLVISILGRHRYFRKYKRFNADWQSQKTLPKVIFLEPDYTDILDSAPNDDHPPTPVHPGQNFIRSIYQTLISNPARWAKTLMLITYDEHGGCYDHVSPLRITTAPPAGRSYEPFRSTGVRVPAFIISPYVNPGTVYKEPLDHTSILHFLAERFDPRQSYSAVVDQRQQFLGKISSALQQEAPRQEIPQAPRIAVPMMALPVLPTTNLALGASTNTEAFQAAMQNMQKEHPRLWKKYRKNNTP